MLYLIKMGFMYYIICLYYSYFTIIKKKSSILQTKTVMDYKFKTKNTLMYLLYVIIYLLFISKNVIYFKMYNFFTFVTLNRFDIAIFIKCFYYNVKM